MPLHQVNGGGWQWGHGKVYHGPYAYELALRQARAVAISKARRAGHKIARRPARPLRYVKSRLRIEGVRAKRHLGTHRLRSGKAY